MDMRFDKKARPYLVCGSCRTRVFLRGLMTAALYKTIAGLVFEKRAMYGQLMQAAAEGAAAILLLQDAERSKADVTSGEPVRARG